MVAAVAARQHDGRFLLSEHGIYVRERLAEIQRAKWVPELPSRRPVVFEELGAFRRLWVEFFKLLGRISYDSADHITSLFARNAEIQQAFGAPAEKIEIVPNGIKTAAFREVGGRRKVAIAEQPSRQNVGFLGRVVRIKDVKTLIRAARLVVDEVPESKFIIAGPIDEEPEYASACVELTEQLELSANVEFRGPMQRDELLVETDVMLLTSVSEGLPFVVIESFGAGVPVVSTDVGSCGELVYGKADEEPALGAAGAVVPVGEPEAVARAVVKLLSDRAAAEAMGEIGRQRAGAHYDEADVVERYRQLYTENEGGGS
jgi:glycosyltransferase involved in cell wall biosynthesis